MHNRLELFKAGVKGPGERPVARKALKDSSHPRPRVINVDGHCRVSAGRKMIYGKKAAGQSLSSQTRYLLEQHS
jgi:hypothetical protein